MLAEIIFVSLLLYIIMYCGILGVISQDSSFHSRFFKYRIKKVYDKYYVYRKLPFAYPWIRVTESLLSSENQTLEGAISLLKEFKSKDDKKGKVRWIKEEEITEELL
jgi:hypothetical protein